MPTARDLVADVIVDALSDAESQGAMVLDIPLGDFVLGRSKPSDPSIASYLSTVREMESLRWLSEGVSEAEKKSGGIWAAGPTFATRPWTTSF